MKLAAAQISSLAGALEQNLRKHLAVVQQAAGQGAELVAFPELSLTGYAPALARQMAMDPADDRLEPLQQACDRLAVLIAVGVPTRGSQGTEISMVVFQPGLARSIYSKQLLHEDELPFFSAGHEQRLFSRAGRVLAPAICYESLQPAHARHAAALGAQVYFTSVAKSERGVAAAAVHYPQVARAHGMTVMMANAVGPADDYLAAGRSGVWNAQGTLVCAAGVDEQALVLYDLGTGKGQVLALEDSEQA